MKVIFFKIRTCKDRLLFSSWRERTNMGSLLSLLVERKSSVWFARRISISMEEVRRDQVLRHGEVRGIADLLRTPSRRARAHTPVRICVCVRRRRARFMPPFAGVYLGMAARFRGWIAASPTVNFAPRRIFVGDYSLRASKIRDDETEHHRVSFGRLAGPGRERPRPFPEFRWDTSPGPGRCDARCTTGFFSESHLGRTRCSRHYVFHYTPSKCQLRPSGSRCHRAR